MAWYDYVSTNDIKVKDFDGYYLEAEFDGSYGGNEAVALEDMVFEYEGEYLVNNVLQTVTGKLTAERVVEDQGTYYPLVTMFIESNGTPHTDVGEGYFNSVVFGARMADYFGTLELNTTEGFTKQHMIFGQGTDSETMAWVQTGDWNEIVASGRTGKQVVFGTNGYLAVPDILNGDPRGGYQDLINPFFVQRNAMWQSADSPRRVTIKTNLPVIAWDYDYYTLNWGTLRTLMTDYTANGDLSVFAPYITGRQAVIVNEIVVPEVTDGTASYQCYSDVYKGRWDVDSVELESAVESRYLEVWVKPNGAYQTPRVSMYKELTANPDLQVGTYRGGFELRAKIKVYGDIVQYRYSQDGGNSWTMVTANYGEVLTLPWDYLYYKRTNETRNLMYDKNHGGNMLLFDTEALCDDGSPYLASDYDEKNFYYPTTNSTGTVETTTLMGTTGLENGFCERYILNKADIETIANDLLASTGMNENLKKGVEMLGESPINAVHGLMYFPVNVASLFNAMTSNTIFIGGYSIQTPSAMKMNGYNGYFDIGSMHILESFPSGDYRNYEPYCNLNIYLPFIGLEQLKMNKYVGKTLSIRYYVDVISGECMACLFADGLLTDYFVGQMGISLSITLNDYSQYAQAHISGNKAMLGNQLSLNPATQLMNLYSDVQAGGLGTSSVFNVSSNALSNFATTKGTDSSMLNHYLPNYVYVIFEIVETDETSNLLTLAGRRSNASGTVGSFSGYLQVESVNLKASGATESEKETIKALLASGIYI